MQKDVIGAVFGFGLTFKELEKNKIPDQFIYSIINNFESSERIMYRMEYLIKNSISLLMCQKNKKNKKDFSNIEQIIEENTPLMIPTEYIVEKEILAKHICIPKNTSSKNIFSWVYEYSSKFDRYQLNIIYTDLPEYFLKHSGLPAEKLTPKSLGCPL